MAKKAEVIITCDGTQVKRVLEEIDRRIKELTANRQALNQKVQAGVQLTKDEIKQDKAWEQEIKALTSAQKKNQAEYQRTRDVMRNIAGSTTQQLKRAYADLAKKLNQTTGEQVQRQEVLRRKMAEVKAQIDKNTGAINYMSKANMGFGGSLKTTLKNLVAYGGVFALFGKIKSTLGDLVRKNAELSDSMANIRKVSQWASSDVEKLTNNLAKIDTRNTISTLQNLGYQGAKLGIGQYGVEGLTGFVRAAEQVQTALGEDLGEEALPALAKLTEVMGLIPKFGVEEAMQKAGSAIYQLGATSTATGQNIVEFSKRLMGLANVSGVTADELLGLGSAADSMALMPEVAATAFNKLFNSINSNTEGIAKAVGLAKEDLTNLLYEGRTMDALVKVFEKMQTMSMAELEGRGVFKELGSDGARLTNVMITMANKVDMLKSHLETSNEAFTEGKAVINEYMIQQETAAAYFERASNIWAKSFINPEGVDVVKQLAQEWYNVSYEMTHSASTMTSIKTTLELLAGTIKMILTYLPTLVQLMMFYGAGAVLQGITLQFKAIYSASTLAGTGVARFNALLKTNAIALATTAVLTFVAKMYELTEATKAAAEAEEKRQRMFTDAAAEALQTYNEQAKALDKYDEALKKSNTTEEERNEIIRQFKSEFGTYLEKLGIEINSYDDMAVALKRVNKELKDKAYYETGQKLKASYVGDAKQEQTNALSQFMQTAQKYKIPTKIMQDIVEGKITNIADAMSAIEKATPENFTTSAWDKARGYTANWRLAQANESQDTGNDILNFITGRSRNRVTQPVEDIYKVISNLINKTKEVNTREDQVKQFLDQYSENYSPQISVEGAILNLKRLKELNEEKLNEGLNVLRDKWKEMSENDRKTNEGKKIGDAIDQYSKQIRALRGEGYVPPGSDKDALKALTKAQQKEKKALKDQMEQAEKDSTAVINAIEEFYRLQESAVEQLVADGKMTREEADKAIEYVKNRKDEMLMNARRAIAGKDSDFEELRKTMDKDMLRPNDVNSQRALNTVQTIDVQKAAKNLQKFDGSKAVYDLNAGSFTQAMLKNAAQNELNIQRRQAAVQTEIDKILLQYQFVEQAQKTFGNKLLKLGLVTDGYDKVVQQLADGTEVVANTKEVQNLATKVVGMDAKKFYGVNPDDAEQLRDLMKSIMTTNGKDKESFASMFPDYDKWVDDWNKKTEEGKNVYSEENRKKYLEQMQAFYKAMVDMDSDYYKALKQNYEQEKREFTERWQYMGWTDQEKRENTGFEMQGSLRKIQGEGENFGQTYGFADEIAEDPEIRLIKNRMEWRAKELEDLKARNASEELIVEKQNEMLKEAAELAEKVSAEVAERIGKIQTLSEPLSSFGEEVGTMLGEQWQGISREGKLTFGQMAKNMGIEYAKLTLKMASENLMKKLQQALFYKQMEMEEMQHQVQMTSIAVQGASARQQAQSNIGQLGLITKSAQDTAEVGAESGKATIMTMFGISEGAAKTIAALGWWGIPLIGVITSILMALLNSAKSTASEATETASATATNPSAAATAATSKLRLGKDMLTYDEGNVEDYADKGRKHKYLGEDGRVYTATEEPAPKDGLVTHPIATTVQGQAALVAEKGPEIVLGRKTTRAIMMNEPGLIRYLANYQQHGGKYDPRRLYDSGTLPATQPSDVSPQTSDNEALMQRLDKSDELMASVLFYLQHPVRPKIEMFSNGGEDGMYESMQKATSFMRRYGK